MTTPPIQLTPQLAAAEVELRLRSDSPWSGTLRRVATDLAVRAGFGPDAVADCQLAVEELCATLRGSARPGGVLVCRYRIDHDTLWLHGIVERGTRPVDLWSLHWHVLTELADEVRTWAADPDPAHPAGALQHVTVRFDPRHADPPR